MAAVRPAPAVAAAHKGVSGPCPVASGPGEAAGKGRDSRPVPASRRRSCPHHPLPGPHPRTTARQAAARLRRPAAALAAATCIVLASVAVMPAAWTVNVIRADGGPDQAPGGAVVTAGGMPGLADHSDRARFRPGRGHRSRPAGPGTGRPPRGLRNHHVRRPPDRATVAAPGHGPPRRPPVHAAPRDVAHATAPDIQLGVPSRRTDIAGAVSAAAGC